jgi:hypothetical protein
LLMLLVWGRVWVVAGGRQSEEKKWYTYKDGKDPRTRTAIACGGDELGP